MYIPRHFHVEDRAELVRFMRAHSFGILITAPAGEPPIASHLPFVVRDDGDDVRLVAHVARANPHWEAIGRGATFAIFTGPHAYVSPAAYERRESVPTWNYTAVHAYGSARIERDPAVLERFVDALVQQSEAAYREQWESLPEKFRAGMLQGIVGIELDVTRLEGKYKLSQNRSATERERVAASLASSDDSDARATAAMMRSLGLA